MAEQVEVLYRLANFASLVEVSVGINLVFSFWDTLRNSAIIRFNEISKNNSKKMAAALGVNYSTSRFASDFDELVNGCLDTLSVIAFVGKWVGLLATCIMVILLMQIGLNPNYEISFLALCFILFVAVVLSPLFIVVGNLYVIYAKKAVEKYGSQTMTSLVNMKEFLTTSES